MALKFIPLEPDSDLGLRCKDIIDRILDTLKHIRGDNTSQKGFCMIRTDTMALILQKSRSNKRSSGGNSASYLPGGVNSSLEIYPGINFGSEMYPT